MKKELLSIVKFFGLALVFLAFSLAVNANKRGFKILADSSKAGSSRFTAASFKKAGSAHKYRASVFGNALNFDGINDYVTMGSGLTLPESGWTEEMWIYLPGEIGLTLKRMGMLLIGSNNMSVNHYRGPFLFVLNGNTLYGGYGYGTGEDQKTYSAHNVLAVNAWNHVAQTYDGSKLKAYVNGNLVVDVEAPEKPNANPIKYLGGPSDYKYFKGSIDEFRIWNRARSAEEIKNNYDKAVDPKNADLLLYYSFNHGTAGGDNTGISSVMDSKRKFEGALKNFALNGSSSNFVASLSFNKPTAIAAENITDGSFKARWGAPAGAAVDKYRLEIARDEKFTNLVPGHENLEVPGNQTSRTVSGLSPDVTYYYRVKGVAGGAISLNSNAISVKTQPLSRFGNALNFDGIGDFVSMGAGLTLPESGWTEEMWIYLPEVVSADVREKGMLVISSDDMTVWSKRGPFFQIRKGTDLHGGYGYGTEDNQRTFDARNALVANLWNHIAQTYDGKRLKAYVNGNLVADVLAPEKPNAYPIKYLGHGISGHYYDFKGSIDELRIWNRARSAEEIRDNCTKMVDPGNPALLLYYSFNQGIVGGDNTGISSVTDSKGNFDGAFHNFALNGSSSNFVASLRFEVSTALAAANITNRSFIANWAAPEGTVDKYLLEVSRDDKFTNLVPGYENLEVPGDQTSQAVIGLSPDVTYYYRVKVKTVSVGVAGPVSNAISVKTLALIGFGNALNFDGIGDFVAMGSGLTLPESGWTEEMWIYLPEVVSADVKTKGMMVISSDDMTVKSKRGPFFQILNGNTLHGGYGYGTEGSQKTYSVPHALAVNAWNHVAQTYDGSRLKAYVNGNLAADVEVPEKPNANPIKYLGLGVLNHYYNFKGSIDELRIWNRARRAEEIRDNYTKTVDPGNPALLLYYSFNHGIAGGDNTRISSVTDSKKKFDGAFHNFALNGASSNFVASFSLSFEKPTANKATDITHGSFTANWAAPAGKVVDKYRLELCRDDKFTRLVPGFENLEVPGNETSWAVSGLSPDITYYYRVRYLVGEAISLNSDAISVKTLALSSLGNALNFDGVNDWVGLGDINFPKNEWTEEMWIYLPDVPPVEVMAVIGNDDANKPLERRPFIQINNGKELQGGYGDGKEQKIYRVDNALTVGAWNHIAQTFDGNRLKAYVNGKEVADVAAAGISNTGPIRFLSNYIWGLAFDNPFKGSIDELRIWNRARSAAEIRDNYTKTIASGAADAAALLLYYSFNQGIAGGNNTGIITVVDSKGRFDGVLNNFALNGSSSNFVGSLVETTANEATEITEGSFTANWAAPEDAIVDKYRLEVSLDDKFTNLVPGYENLEVPGNQTSKAVSGLSPDVTYYYKVKGVAGEATGWGSNIISVKTQPLSGLGNALNFDGIGDFVAMGAGLTLPESGWTEEMWIYVPEVSPDTKEKGMLVIGGDDMTVKSKRGAFLFIDDGNTLYGGYGYGTGESLRTYNARNVLAVNAWNHIAQTYDGSRLKAYVNGKKVADVEAPEKPNANPIKYLGRGLSGYYYDFKGVIDEFRVWNRVRSAAEIRDNYTKTVDPAHADLLLYYSFNHGTAGGDNTGISSVTDSKWKLEGVLNNFALNGSSSNFVGSLVLAPPKAVKPTGTNITDGSFTANWEAPAGTVVDKYRLEVSRDDKFTRLVPGYENLEVPGNQTSQAVIGLSPDVTYYYRVKTVSGGATSEGSNAISVKTLALSGLGNALNFDGEGDFVAMEAGLTLPESGWTEEMWIYLPEVSPYFRKAGMTVIGSDDMEVRSKRGAFLQIFHGNDLHGGYGTGGSQKTYYAPHALAVNAWNHIAQTYDGSRLKAYVNGKEVADVEAPEKPNANPIKYLGRGVHMHYYEFKGVIDEFRIWNRARSAEEIKDNYTKTVDPAHADLLLYYSFNQGLAGGDNTAVNLLIDHKGAYNATLEGFAKAGETSNFTGSLKLVPPVVAEAADITEGSFKAKWTIGAGSSPTPNKYFLDVSTDATFADPAKFVSDYQNKNVGHVTEYAVTGLKENTPYYYRVRAGYDNPWYHLSANSNSISVRTLLIPVVTALAAANTTDRSFIANWAASVGKADKYRLEVARDDKFTNLVPGYENLEVPGNQTSQAVIGLSPDFRYYYRVKAVSVGVTGPVSNAISVKTLALIGFGNALNFDGSNYYVAMGEGLTLPESGWTEEMWIYVPEVSPAVKTMGMTVIGSDDMTVFSKRGPSLFVRNGNTLYGGYGTGGSQKTYSAPHVLAVNAWNHVAQTYDGSRLKAYVNGNLVIDVEAPEKPNANPIKYLGRGLSGYYYPFKGSIDEFRIWNRARSAEEIRDNYTKTVDPGNPALLLYYSFNQGIAGGDNTGISSVTDSKKKFDGALHNFALKGASSNFVASFSLSFEKPTANEATDITQGSFTANWAAPAGKVVDKYRLEVYRGDMFTGLVPGFENLELPGNQTSRTVSGLSPDITYYYRVKAVMGEAISLNSNAISVKTQPLNGLGNALNFTGNEMVTISNEGISFPDNKWTEEMWIYPSSDAYEPYEGLLANAQQVTNSSLRGPCMYVANKTKLHGGYGDGKEWKKYITGEVLQPSVWNHVAQTFDGTTLKVYVNGVMVESFHLPGISNANKINYIGNKKTLPSPGGFRGNIDELRIWKTARSAEEIRDNYTKTVDPAHADLLLYYSFNHGTAGGDNTGISSVTDSKGGINGALHNFALKGSSSNFVGSLVLAAPKAVGPVAESITNGSFTANWEAPAGTVVDKYRLEVSRDDKFTRLVPGYENLEVPGNQTSQAVIGLSPDVTYYYRVKTVSRGATSEVSNAISVKTLALSGLGNALNFDGAGDFVSMGAGLTLSERGWTEEMWIYLPEVSSAAKTMGMTVIGCDDMTVFSKRGPFLFVGDGNTLHGGYGYGTGGSQKTYYAPHALAVNAWNHVAQTYDGSRLKAYVNGKEVADVEAPEKPNANPIKYLGRGVHMHYYDFKGVIDEFRIWNRARSAAEIRDNYTKTVDPGDPALLLYYSFNQGLAGGDNTAVNLLIDHKGAYNAKLEGFAKAGATSNFVGALKLSPPVAGEAENIAAGSFKAKWTAGANSDPAAVKYFLDVSADATFADPAKFVTGYPKDVGLVTEFTATELKENTPYYYRVRAGYDNPWYHPSANSNSISVRTAITLLAATDITEDSFTANWVAPEGKADNYILEVARDDKFTNLVPGCQSLSVPAGATSRMISGLSPDITYYHRVKAAVGGVPGPGSNIISVKTTALSGLGNALNFTGKEALTISGEGISFPFNEWTEEMWVYVSSEVNAAEPYESLLANIKQLENGSLRGPSIYIYDKTKLHGGYGDGKEWKKYTTSKEVLQPDAWNHVAQTFDGATLKVYVNGCFVESFHLPGTSNKYKINYIGNKETEASSHKGFRGNIDELRIWNYPRSAEEIRDNYKIPVAPGSAGLIAYYDFNQGVSGGDNTAINILIDNKDAYNAILNNFDKTGSRSNFVGNLIKLTPPAANLPTNFTKGSFRANWVAPEGTEVNSYILEVAEDAGFTKLVRGYENLRVPAGSTSREVSGLSPNCTYYYRVRALTGFGASPNSDIVEAQTRALIGLGNALNFTGNEALTISNEEISFPSNKWTLEMWVYTSSDFDTKEPYQSLLSNAGQLENASLRGPSIYIYDKTKLHGGYGDGKEWKGYTTSKKVLLMDAWNHVAQTFDGTTLKVYVNGVMVESFNLPGTSTVNKILYIGNNKKVEGDQGFYGNIDELRIWKTDRSAEDIKNNYTNSVSKNETDLIAYYDFNQGIADGDNRAINTLIDNKNAYNATLEGFAKTGSSSNFVGELKLVPPVASEAINVSRGSFTAKWAMGSGSSPKPDKYFLDISTDPSFAADKFVPGYQNKDVGLVTEFTVRGLNPSTAYYYRLRAKYTGSWLHTSVISNTVTVNTIALLAPKGLAATNLSEGSFTANWEKSLDPNVNNYILEVSRDDKFTNLVSGYENLSIPAGATTGIIKREVIGLSPDFTYYYRVKAVADETASAAGNIISAKTLSLSGLGNALNFDGDDDFVTMGASLTLPESGWTEEMWIYLPEVSREVKFMVLISDDDMYFLSKRGPFLFVQDGNVLHGGYGTGETQKTIDAYKALAVNAWNHIAQTYDGSRLKLYVNGKLIKDVEAPEKPNANPIKYIGKFFDGHHYAFKGSIDELRIWNYPRSAEEIRDNYKIPVAPGSEGLVAYYDFNQGVAGGDNRAIKTLIDNKGGYNAKLEGFAKTGASSNFVGELKLAPPVAIQASNVTYDSFTANWTAGAGSSLKTDKYFLDVSTDPSFADEGKFVADYRNKDVGLVTEFTVRGLNRLSAYYYRLRSGSVSELYSSAWSNVIKVNTVPNVIRALAATNLSEGSFTANWEDPGDPSVSSYILEVSRDDKFTNLVPGYENLVVRAGATTGIIKKEVIGLSPDFTYYYRLRAVVGGLSGAAGNVITVKTQVLRGLGNALNFTGKEKVVISNEGISFPENKRTEEMWVYVSSEVYEDESYENLLANKPDEDAFLQRAGIYVYNKTKLYVNYGDGEEWKGYTTSKEVLQTDVWNHVAQTFDGATLKVYVNGVFVESFDFSGISNTYKINYIGNKDAKYSNGFRGNIDELRIWNYPRSAEEIRDNYKIPVAPGSAGLIAYYDFNQGIAGGDNRAIETLIDNKGGYNAKLEGFAKTGASSNFVGELKLAPPVASQASNVTYDSFTANWTAGAGPSLKTDKYFLDVSTDPSFADERKFVADYRNKDVGLVTEFTVRGLNRLSAYYYRLRSGSVSGLYSSAWSNVIKVNTVPNVIKALAATNLSEGSFTANWEYPGDPSVSSYILEVSRDDKFTNLVPGYENLVVRAGATAHAVSGLSPDFTYYYRLKAVVGGLSGVAGNVITVKTQVLRGLGNALNFTDKEKVIFSNGDISFSENKWTQEAWVYIPTLVPSYAPILDCNHEEKAPFFEGPCSCLIIDKTKLHGGYYDGGEKWKQYTTSKDVFTIGAWNHLAQTYDGTTLKIYVNGVFVESLNLPCATTGTVKTLNIAAFQGSIDELRIWDYPRSAEEIRDNYKIPVAPGSAGLIAYYDFNQGVAGGDNRAIETLIDNKGAYNGVLKGFAKTGLRSNFVGELKLEPPVAGQASNLTYDSFTANWAMGAGSSPLPDKYFLDVSTDETFADERKFVADYRNKDVGHVTEITVRGLNPAKGAYYYRVRAGYADPWIQSSVNSNTISVNAAGLPSVTALSAKNITKGSFTATWQPPSDRLADNYILKVSRDAGFTNLVPGYENLVVPADATWKKVNGLSPDFTYYYKVKAVFEEAVGVAGNIIEVKTAALTGLGNALNHDGKDDYVALWGISNTKKEWTEEMWVYLPDEVSPVRKVMELINIHSSIDGTRSYLQINNGKDLQGGYFDEVGYKHKTYSLYNALTVGAWNHLAQTSDGNRLKAYVNGVEVADIETSGISNIGPIDYLSDSDATNSVLFKGSLDELRIWNRARSAEEIRDNYKIPVAPGSPGLIAYYDFNQGIAGGDNRAIETLIDNKGGYNAKLEGFAKTGASSNFVGELKLAPPVAGQPSNVTYSSFTASWTADASSSPSPDKYFLDVSTDETFADGGIFVSDYQNKNVGHVTKFTVTGLDRLKTYYYRVRAGYADPWFHSSVSSNVIKVNTVPNVIRALEATNLSEGSFTANWEDPGDPSVSSYILEVSRDDKFTNLVLGYQSLSVLAGATAHTVSGLSPDFTYYYRLRAVVGELSGNPGNTVQAKTRALRGLGNALNFTGNEAVVISNEGISFPDNKWTEEMWVYVSSDTNKEEPYEGLLTNVIQNGDWSLRGPSMYIYNKTKLHGGYGDGTNWKEYTTGDVLQPGSWNHLAQTFNGADLKVYVNGVFVASFNLLGTSNVYKINYIGNKRSLPYSGGFQGNIDELRIWNYPRSAEEIRDNYKIPVASNSPGLIAYYDFNQGVAGGDNRAIETLIDNKETYKATLEGFAKTDASSNFVGDLKLTPPEAGDAGDITLSSFTAKWTMGAGSSPKPDKYFLDVSTDPAFADEGKFVPGYRNTDVGHATEITVTGLNLGAYYYRVRAGYGGSWLHPSVHSNTISVNIFKTNSITLASTDVKVYGDLPYQLEASGLGTGAYTYTVTEGDAVSISNTGQVTVLKAGIATIVVNQAADAVYGSAGPVTQTITVQPKGLTIIATAANKEYDGSKSASVTLSVSGTVNGDKVTAIAGEAIFDNKDVGIDKPVAINLIYFSGSREKARNYALANVPVAFANITAKPVTVTFSAHDKVYDGSATATGKLSVEGAVEGDDVSASFGSMLFDNAYVGTNKPVKAVDISLQGLAAGNYCLTGTTAVSTAAINPKYLISALAFKANTLYERSPIGTLAGTLTASSADPDAVYAYWLVPEAVDNSKFIIKGDKLYTSAVLNYASQSVYTVRVQVSHQSGVTFTKDFLVTIFEINKAPTIAAIPDQSVCATTENYTINLSGITPGSETGQTTSLSITSDNKGMFNALSVTPLSGGKGIISYFLKAGVSGSAVITVTVKDDGGTAGGGIDSYSVSFTVNVNPLPVINISTNTGKLRVVRGRTIELTATAPGATAYSWADAKGIINGQNTARLTVKPTEPTVYTVGATSASGCIDVKQIAIEVDQEYSDVIAGNMITLNGDGVNDLWVIENIEYYPNATVKVFDRGKRLVFSQIGYDNKWNGYYNGRPLRQGAYYYVISIGKGKNIISKGYLTIINEQ